MTVCTHAGLWEHTHTHTHPRHFGNPFRRGSSKLLLLFFIIHWPAVTIHLDESVAHAYALIHTETTHSIIVH